MVEGVAVHRLARSKAGKVIDYIILKVNPAFEKQTGISRKKAEGALASTLYLAKEPPFLRQYAAVVASGKSISFEVPFAPLNKYFRISAFAIGKDGFVTVFEDITSSVKAVEAIKDSEFKYKTLAEQIGQLFYDLDVKSGALRWDGNIEEITGFSRKYFKNFPINVQIH